MLGQPFDPARYFLFLALLALLATIGAALGLMVGSLVKDVQQGQQACMPTLIPLLLFSGCVLPCLKGAENAKNCRLINFPHCPTLLQVPHPVRPDPLVLQIPLPLQSLRLRHVRAPDRVVQGRDLHGLPAPALPQRVLRRPVPLLREWPRIFGLGQREPGRPGQEVRAARRHLLRVSVRGLRLHVHPRAAQDELIDSGITDGLCM